MKEKQPYIYTLPEGFLQDESVPLRWKLYALINGFWVSGKTVFASNEFFAEKLGCTERHIQRCLEALEEFNAVQRIGEGTNRRIVPWGTTSGVVGGRPLRSEKDDLSDRHISDSISDKLTLGEAGLRVEKDSEEKKKDTRKYPNADKVFKLWGKYPKHWLFNASQRQAAENLYEEQGIDDIASALRYIEQHKNDEFFPEINSPWDLDTKWAKLETHFKKHA